MGDGNQKSPAFPFYAKDWLADDKRTEMNAAQRGIYVDLLAYQWNNGSVPAEPADMARITGETAATMRKLFAGPLAKAFPANGDGRRRNPKLEEWRADQESYRARRSQAGKAGARSRWGG